MRLTSQHCAQTTELLLLQDSCQDSWKWQIKTRYCLVDEKVVKSKDFNINSRLTLRAQSHRHSQDHEAGRTQVPRPAQHQAEVLLPLRTQGCKAVKVRPHIQELLRHLLQFLLLLLLLNPKMLQPWLQCLFVDLLYRSLLWMWTTR